MGRNGVSLFGVAALVGAVVSSDVAEEPVDDRPLAALGTPYGRAPVEPVEWTKQVERRLQEVDGRIEGVGRVEARLAQIPKRQRSPRVRSRVAQLRYTKIQLLRMRSDLRAGLRDAYELYAARRLLASVEKATRPSERFSGPARRNVESVLAGLRRRVDEARGEQARSAGRLRSAMSGPLPKVQANISDLVDELPPAMQPSQQPRQPRYHRQRATASPCPPESTS